MSLSLENIRATKILAIDGQARASAGGLAALLDDGVNVFRLNFPMARRQNKGCGLRPPFHSKLYSGGSAGTKTSCG
mgnify:CR=1 FL=1